MVKTLEPGEMLRLLNTARAPEAIREAVARFDRNTLFDVSIFPASSLANTIQKAYPRRASVFAPLIEALKPLADTQVIYCQAAVADEVIAVILRNSDRSFVAAIEHDASGDRRNISLTRLLLNLRSSPIPLASDMLRELESSREDRLIALHPQSAKDTAVMFPGKYSPARHDGVAIDGLEDFVSQLLVMGDATVLLATVDTTTGYWIIALGEGDESVIGVMSVQNDDSVQ